MREKTEEPSGADAHDDWPGGLILLFFLPLPIVKLVCTMYCLGGNRECKSNSWQREMQESCRRQAMECQAACLGERHAGIRDGGLMAEQVSRRYPSIGLVQGCACHWSEGLEVINFRLTHMPSRWMAVERMSRVADGLGKAFAGGISSAGRVTAC